MSVIDKVLQGQSADSPRFTLREAAAAILVSAVASDGTLAPEEGVRLNALVGSMHLYKDVEPGHVQHLIEQSARLASQHGVDALLPVCAAVVPEELAAPLFALAVELVFVDGRVAEREKRFVDALQSALGIGDDLAMKIIEVLLLKSRA